MICSIMLEIFTTVSIGIFDVHNLDGLDYKQPFVCLDYINVTLFVGWCINGIVGVILIG